jgi:hypothetical protein
LGSLPDGFCFFGSALASVAAAEPTLTDPASSYEDQPESQQAVVMFDFTGEMVGTRHQKFRILCEISLASHRDVIPIFLPVLKAFYQRQRVITTYQQSMPDVGGVAGACPHTF